MTKQTQSATNATKAVIYCRVSSAAQLAKGHGNASQETRCREYARLKGYEVAEVFSDDAVSGSAKERPSMSAMLTWLNARKRHGNFVVIIDDISRLARDIKAHLELRSSIASAGARLESPSLEFGEDSDSQLVENLLASVSQHQRQKNAEQTRNRMRARIMNGYWPFIGCMGYRFEHRSGEGKVLVRDEPLASVLQEGLEGFASGRFQMQTEVRRFFESHPDFTAKDKHGRVRGELVRQILHKPLYAGYVEAPDWGVSLRKGRHAGLIDLATFERIQARIKEGARVPARPDINNDFPLRGAISCSCCGNPFTASWSRSKTGKRHPYYQCFTQGCERYGKSIRRDQLEGEFVKLLDTLTPAPKLFTLARAMFKDEWTQRTAQARALALSYEREAAKVEKQIAGLLERIMDASSQTVIRAYEARIESLERSKLALAEKQERSVERYGTFEELFELAFGFLSNPSKLWHTGIIECQKMVLKLTFADRLAYCRDSGFRTPKTTLPFKALGDMRGLNGVMAEGKNLKSNLLLRQAIDFTR